MADFYSEMQAMASGLLAPTSNGGLGQGSIKLIKTTSTAGANDWDPSTDVVEELPLNAAARGISKELIGVEVGGTVLVASDLQVICSVPSKEYTEGDSMTIDGKAYAILSFQNIPAAGITAAVKFIVRG